MIDKHGEFKILGFEAIHESGVVRLHYGYDSGLEFCETIDFHHPLPSGANSHSDNFEAAINALCVLAGVSYYKAYVPDTIIVEAPKVSNRQLAFFRNLYFNGLGEFAFRNGLDLSNSIRFSRRSDAESSPADEPTPAAPPHAPLPHRAAVLIGGGKDSLVSIEMLRSVQEPMVLFAVNPKKPILDCAAASNLPFISVSRHLDPKLFELNAAGALNGHVPITAIVSFIAIAAAFVHGFDSVILSNERSANEATLESDGVAVNHQFSKTASVETDIRRYIAENISSELSYFSLLRPLSELHIAQLFRKTDAYDNVFTSCNRAFRLQQQAPSERWCCDCPKCRFTFLILATAMPFERIVKIFGTNMLDDARQLVGYEELAGLSGHKPWECVGEISETRASILVLAKHPVWRESLVIRELAPRLAPLSPDVDQEWRRLLTPSRDHYLTPHFERIVDAYVSEK